MELTGRVLKLDADLAACPSAWRNWIRDFNQRWNPPQDLEPVLVEQQHYHDAGCELAVRWRARFTGQDHNWDTPGDLVFESARDCTLFVLAWS